MTPHVFFPALDDSEADETQVDLIDLVLVETPQWLRDIRAAAADRDRNRLLTLLHALESTMSLFGMRAVCQAVREFEELVEHEEWSAMRRKFVGLAATCSLAISGLRRSHKAAQHTDALYARI
jgi:hypothetical protein